MSAATRRPVHVEMDVRQSGPDGAFGFVVTGQNRKGEDCRVGFIGGVATGDKADHETKRFAPYLFPANWGIPTHRMMAAAWEALTGEGHVLPGFETADPNVVRVVTLGHLYQFPIEFMQSDTAMFVDER